MFEKDIYIKRRQELSKNIKNGLILLLGNKESARNYRGNNYNFEQDSNFLYYFGLDIPNLVGVIDVDNNKEYIFGKDYTIDDIIWLGNQKLLKEHSKDVGVENFLEFDEIYNFFQKSKNRKIHILPQYRGDTILEILDILGIAKNELESYISVPLIKAIVSQRNTKSPEEIKEIEDAVNITAKMHLSAMKSVKEGMKEYEIVAILESITKKYNGSTSFQTIFSKNGQILHNPFHNNTLKNGDIVLLDCGARNKNGYCGDMTTSFPVGGKFDERQKDIYSLLIEMFETAEKLLKPHINYKDIHLAVCKVLAQGMVDRGLLKGDVETIVKEGVHALFMPHGLGHMLGLDVHDMEGLGEDYVGYDKFPRSNQFGLKALRLARKLKPGYVLTVEPGIYFIPELVSKWKKENKFVDFINYDVVEKYLDFGGMRYEGDFLITDTSSRRLGDKMPKYYYEIEEIMAKSE